MASASGSFGIAQGSAAPATTTALVSPPLVAPSRTLASIEDPAEKTLADTRAELGMELTPPKSGSCPDVSLGTIGGPALVLTMPSPPPTMPRRSRSSPGRRALLVVTAFVLALLVFVLAALATIVACYDVRTVDLLPVDVSAGSGAERVPRIIHQTWKTAELPERWRNVSESCRALHPSYEYRLWTDEDGRELIREHYPSFLPTYDAYPFTIERADAMRYFILRKFGGVYLDLDVGCRRPFDALLEYGAVLPYTKPVGVSNDVMFSAKEHPFMRFVTEHLAEQAGWYGTKYPTVMFATGPMLVSRLYNRYIAELGDALTADTAVRIIPRPLYGKSQYSADDSNDPFFRHYFASSWHGDDAGAIAALAVGWHWLLIGCGAVAALGLVRLLIARIAHRPEADYLSLPTSVPSTPDMQQVPFATPQARSPASASDLSVDEVPSAPAYVALNLDHLSGVLAQSRPSPFRV